MNDPLLNISLNQGKQFKKYQQKIKKNNKTTIREGFVSGEQESILRPEGEGYKPVLQNQNNNLNKFNSVNKQELNELVQLQQSYTTLLDQYNAINKSIGDSSLASINRTSSSNPYLGKNIRFTDGTVCYVTSQGIVRRYPTQDIFNNTAGLNGCPGKTDIININIAYNSSFPIGSSIPTTPPLIIGQDMVQNASCGNEGKNVYASTLLNNPSSSYVGCYNDKPPVTNVSILPLYNSSEFLGFGVSWSSTYENNFDLYGGPKAFDQDPNTYFHTDDGSQHKYNDQTGVYEGINSKSVNTINSGLQSINGENLQIFFPNAGLSNSQKAILTQYSLAPRLDDCCLTSRSPNSWYIAGLKDNQLYEVDRQTSQSFTDGNPKIYNVSQPGSYDSYVIIVDKVGNDDKTSNRSSLQIAEWSLFSNTNYTLGDDQRAMIWNPDTIGYTTYDNCQKYAVDNGYQYFGLQDYKTDGTAACLVSNDLSRSEMYGDGSNQVSATPLWSSNTQGTGTNSCRISREGKLQVIGSDGSIKWESPNAPEDCAFGGRINPDSITATYGANCNSSGANVATGNATDKIKQISSTMPSWTANFIVTVDNNTFGDPAPGCSKNWDTSYQCGTAWKTSHIDSAEGQAYNYDCIKEVNSCWYFSLILQDDGNMCLYRGTSTQSIWCTYTNGKQQGANPQWSATNGKIGKNTLGVSDTLGPGDWIGSNDGSLKLIMQTDGNLVLYTSQIKAGCQKDGNGQMYGNSWINALYKLDTVGNKASLGKLGYIDANSNLREYPDSMLELSNEYTVFDKTDSGGNDIYSLQVTDQNSCQSACNDNEQCSAYVYQATTNSCWIKNSNAYPKGTKQYVNGLVLGVRKPKPTALSSCSNEVVNVDTVMYDKYVKGNPMTTDTQCNQTLVSSEDLAKLTNIESQLYELGQNIASKMENLYNQDNNIYEKMNMNSQQFKKNIDMYKNTKTKINQLLQEKQSNNRVEGMNTMNDINGMISDTDLRVLQENYKYIFWSILAVSAITITLNIMKK
jgi:hypothetical protein